MEESNKLNLATQHTHILDGKQTDRGISARKPQDHGTNCCHKYQLGLTTEPLVQGERRRRCFPLSFRLMVSGSSLGTLQDKQLQQ